MDESIEFEEEFEGAEGFKESNENISREEILPLKKMGIDVGFGYTKIFKDGNLENQIKFPSVVGDYKTIGFDSGMSTRSELENLRVEIDGQRFFIGDLAIEQSSINFSTNDKNRINSKENDILYKTAIALSLNEDSRVKLAVGLPVGEYEEQKEEIKNKLIGNHKVTIFKEKEEITRKFKVDAVKPTLQPFAAYLNEILDYKGEIVNPKLAKGRVVVADIGFLSFDVLLIDNMNYIEKESDSYDSGMNIAYDIINEKLKEKYDIDKENHELEEIIRNQEIKVVKKGSSQAVKVDLSNLINQAFDLAAMKIYSQFNSLVNNQQLLDKILVVGGGGNALYDKINFPYDNHTLAENSQYSVLNGLQKLAERVF